MRILSRVRSALFGPPPSSAVVAGFSRMVEADPDRAGIGRCLEAVLRRTLKRAVAVIPAGSVGRNEKDEPPDDGLWVVDQGAIASWLDMQRLEADVESKVAGLFGFDTRRRASRIAVLVPVLSGSGSRLATVVIGRWRFWPLTGPERSMIASVVAAATLLFEQTRLRQTLEAATAEAETIKGLVESHRGHIARRYGPKDYELN